MRGEDAGDTYISAEDLVASMDDNAPAQNFDALLLQAEAVHSRSRDREDRSSSWRRQLESQLEKATSKETAPSGPLPAEILMALSAAVGVGAIDPDSDEIDWSMVPENADIERPLWLEVEGASQLYSADDPDSTVTAM